MQVMSTLSDRKPSVSVIIAAFNAGTTISKTLESIAQQTRKPDEVIIVDDCSNDNTLKVINSFKQKLKLTVLRNRKNFGAAVSRNKAILAAKTDYIALIDADDEWHPEKLSKQINFMEKNNLLFSHTSFYKQYGSLNRILSIRSKDVTTHDLVRGNDICCSTVIVERNLIQQYLFPNLRMRQDWALWLNLSSKIGTLRVYPEALATYNAEGGMSKRYLRLFFHQIHFFKVVFRVNYIVAINLTFKYAARKLVNERNVG